MKQTYRCPKCRRTCTVYIKLNEPPICTNPNKHRLMPAYMEPTRKNTNEPS